jgi:translation elongation factor EF-Tu-like GTPase
MANDHVNLTKSYPRDIEARITFLSTSEGGKKIAARTGYRVQFRYDEQDWFALHTFPDVERVNPGETVRAYITFLSPEDHRGKLSVGKTFQLREGEHVMANGVIIRIIELETRKSAPLEPPSWNYLD